MLGDDRNAADEFTTMSSAIKSTLKWGGGGSLAVHVNNFQAGEVFQYKKRMCLNDFCLRLSKIAREMIEMLQVSSQLCLLQSNQH